MQSLRDEYIKLVKNNYHYDTVKYFIKYQLIMMYPIIPFFVDHFLLNKQFTEIIMDGDFNHNRMLDIDVIDNLTIDMELKWKNDYMKSLIKYINEKLFSYYSKKKVFSKIKIYTAQKISNNIDLISHKIISNHITSSEDKSNSKSDDKVESKTINNNTINVKDTKDIIKEAKKQDQDFCKNNKNVGLIIETYRNMENVINTYGINLFNKIINDNNMEHNTVKEMIGYYYQYDKANDKYKIIGLPNDMTIEVINDNTNIGRIFNPVFRFE
jgi:hypothetical protein